MSATAALPYAARDRYPVMCYPMPWAPPQYERIAGEMGLDRPSRAPQPAAMYMHIPFCDYLCGFCPFVKYLKDEDRVRKYLDDLKREMAAYAETPYFRSTVFGSLYMGGGTASSLSGPQLADVVSFAREHFTFTPDAEITLESSPITIDPDKFAAVRVAGVNRASFGVQTFDKEIGKASDVAQDGETSLRVIRWAQEAGIDHISIDLIYNLPGQSVTPLLTDLDIALDAGVKQITLFPLSIMPHTKLFRDVNDGRASRPGDLAHELDLCRRAGEHLARRGLRQTSVPDFSLPDVAYQHARIHFTDFGDLLGLGAGAMGTVNEYTYVNVAELKRYTELTGQGMPPVNAGQLTPHEERPRATLAMGLRMISVARRTFRERHGQEPEDLFGPLLDDLTRRDLLVCDTDEIRLTELGALFGYDVAKEFYSDDIRARGQKLAESLARKRDVAAPAPAQHATPK